MEVWIGMELMCTAQLANSARNDAYFYGNILLIDHRGNQCLPYNLKDCIRTQYKELSLLA